MWARNPYSHLKSARSWHFVTTGYLRGLGINTPTFRKDSWEIDWSKRNGKKVWARNPESKMPSAHHWHWIDFSTLARAGIPWKPKTIKTGRYIDNGGYVVLTRLGMTVAQVEMAHKYGLFRGKRKTFVREHQLVAAQKYGRSVNGFVVRHINGIKSDNRLENLVLGTTQENTMDHNSARLAAMFWRNKYEQLVRHRTKNKTLAKETGPELFK